MMRVLRALAFLAVGLLLGGVSVYASAETQPATVSSSKGYTASQYSGVKAWADAVAAVRAAYSTNFNISGQSPTSEPAGNVSVNLQLYVVRKSDGYAYWASNSLTLAQLYVCPAGQNWTLSGQTCSRPDCVSPEVRDPADGVCKPPACPTGQTKQITQFSGKWAVCGKQQASCLTGSLNMNSVWCDGSCSYDMGAGVNQAWADTGSTVDNPKPVYWIKTGTSNGQSCSQPTNNDPGSPPVVPQKKPPCLAGEGVLTTSSGIVKCVPEATPGNPPKTTSTKTTQETETDVKETTCTNTTDPVSGAVNKNCTTVTTPKAPGSTPTTSTKSTDVPANPSKPGQAGPDNSGNEPGQCEKEPDSPMCKKGTPKEKGQLPGIGTAEAELVQAKADLTAKFNEVKTAASQMFGTVGVGGGGSLPCPPPVSIMGKPISFCLTQYESTISMIGGGVMFIAAILSAFIILL